MWRFTGTNTRCLAVLSASVLWALCGWACTTGDINGPGGTGDINALADGIQTDGVASDTGSDSAGPDVNVDTGENCDEEEGPPPQPGEFGYPCTTNSECNSGWCVASENGNICTKMCLEDCPDQFTCRQVSLGDPVFLCLPQFLHLCDPCETNADCRFSEADADHACLDLGAEGKFCGGDCSANGECPCGFDCRTVPVGGGQTKAQCVPVIGSSCSCSPLAIDLQDTTTCIITNDNGSCSGTRYCSPNGLTDCDARVPEVETCNGLDDNCDGAYDNLPPDYQCAKTNTFGTCLGSATCIGGVEICDAPSALPDTCDGLDNDCNGVTDDGFADTDGDLKADCIDEDDDNDTIPDTQDNCQFDANLDQVNYDGDQEGDVCDEDDDNDGVPDSEDCEPLDPAISQLSVELCDGLDNNCNGLIDDNLCDDGEPCTDDSCNADGSCAHSPLNGQPCEDGEGFCTVSDICLNGVCTGNPVNCDDGNVCTEDLCNPGNGECANLSPPKNDDPCDDGSECTLNDKCVNGVCNGTFAIEVCDDNNECTTDVCQGGQCMNLPAQPNIDCTVTYSATVGAIPECKKAQCNSTGSCLLQNASGDACGTPLTCTAGFCQGGACQPTTNNDPCSTGSSKCPTGSCATGTCVATAGIACDAGGSLCDGNESGLCTGSGSCIKASGSQCSGSCGAGCFLCVCCCPAGICINICLF